MNNEYRIVTGQGDEQLISDALSVRNQVFVQEQHISEELEVDGKDSDAFHVVVYANNQPVATGRLVISDLQIARIAVIPEHRKKGFSFLVLDQLEEYASAKGLPTVKLTPHLGLLEYYGKRGYQELPDSRFSVAGHNLTVMSKDL